MSIRYAGVIQVVDWTANFAVVRLWFNDGTKEYHRVYKEDWTAHWPPKVGDGASIGWTPDGIRTPTYAARPVSPS